MKLVSITWQMAYDAFFANMKLRFYFVAESSATKLVSLHRELFFRTAKDVSNYTDFNGFSMKQNTSQGVQALYLHFLQ